ncbi:MAG: MFS transporter [Actinomycetota bacterium]
MSAGPPATSSPHLGASTGVLAASILTTVSSVYPAFLAGALGPELRADVGMTERFFGLVVGGFFAGSAIGSVRLGRLGERLGARRMITASLVTTALVSAVIAAAVRSGPALVAAMVVAGLANSSGQTAANKLLSQSIAPDRLGVAMAIKQSGMPAAVLLGGLAVPAIALTVGWPWAYVAAAALALIGLAVVRTYAPTEPGHAGTAAASTAALVVSRPRTLLLAAVAAGFSSAAAGTLGNWFTNSATGAGWTTGAAGLLLSVGAIAGITSRLLLGRQADRRAATRDDPVPAMRTAAGYLAFGAIGALLLAPRVVPTHAVAAIVAFAAGWSWPALFNYAVVRTNPDGAAQATGVTQTGVYIGVFTGPILMGLLVESWGYELGWTVIATSMLVGATIMWRIAPEFTGPTQSR